MDGLLVVDKPAGLTSHDVVARVRRLLRERSVGHTGTLDPAATGVLPLVLGRATRLARFLSAGDKEYEAVVRLGVATDTGDASGTPLNANEQRHQPVCPGRDAIEHALDGFRGPFVQQPPAFSAKKIGGTRSYRLARRQGSDRQEGQEGRLPAAPILPNPVPVVVHRLDVVEFHGDQVTLRVECSAGFYVRSLAHDLGARLGTGAHLAALRRTRSGDYALDGAIGLETAERDPERAMRHVIPLARMVPGLPAVALTSEGVRRVTHGRDLGPRDFEHGLTTALPPTPYVRLLNPDGDLIGVATSMPSGLLHPSVVLV